VNFATVYHLLDFRFESPRDGLTVELLNSDFDDVRSLMSNRHNWTTAEITEWRNCVQLARQLFPQETAEFMADLISRIECNNFGLWTANKENCYCRVLYPLASFFNHSCAPNCLTLIEGPLLSITAARPIAAGEELCIQYIDVNIPRSARISTLWSEYRFRCHCSRCALEIEKSEAPHFTYSRSIGKKKKRGRRGTFMSEHWRITMNKLFFLLNRMSIA